MCSDDYRLMLSSSGFDEAASTACDACLPRPVPRTRVRSLVVCLMLLSSVGFFLNQKVIDPALARSHGLARDVTVSETMVQEIDRLHKTDRLPVLHQPVVASRQGEENSGVVPVEIYLPGLPPNGELQCETTVSSLVHLSGPHAPRRCFG